MPNLFQSKNMLQNYLKVALRNLLRNKSITLTNLTGLVAGMAAAILIWQYVAYEKSYDRFHQNADRVYRVRTDRFPQGVPDLKFAAGAACAGPLLKSQYEEIEDFVKIYPVGERVFISGDVNVRMKDVAYTSSSFFHVFSFPLIQGDPQKCLSDVWSAVISESVARRFFGNENPLGKTFKMNTGDGATDQFTVTGVFQDMPENSHMKWNVLLSYVTFATIKIKNDNSETEGFWDGFLTYLLLKPNSDALALQQKFPALLSQKFGDKFQSYKDSMAFTLQPLPEIHLQSHHLLEAEVNGDGSAVGFLSMIGGLVLIIAWFNYINLSTARAQSRAREVGIRKSVGSGRLSLILQFLTESAILNGAAILIAMGLAWLLLPAFSELAGKKLADHFLNNPTQWLAVFTVFVAGTVLAGLYPAVVLSSFKPARVLKGGTAGNPPERKKWSISLRKSLVVAQFVASVCLIAGTIVVFSQLKHMRSVNLGLNLDKTLIVKAPAILSGDLIRDQDAFKSEIKRVAAIHNVATSDVVPGEPFNWLAGGIRRWNAPETESKAVKAMAVDQDFVDTYQISMVAGRNFSADMASDSNACMLNERAVSHLGLGSPEQAVGADINFWGEKLHIVGVVKNFHQQSPKEVFDPLVMRVRNSQTSTGAFSIKLETSDLQSTLGALRARWASIFPGNPFDYFFLEEHFEEQYLADQRFGQVFGMFALLAIFVSCLGLFALAAYVARVRTKEIGVRKVLGASVANVTAMLTRDFLRLVLVAIVIATPLAWYFMQQWLTNFADRITMQWWFFVCAGIIAVAIAFLTVGFQSAKAAMVNPVKSLRSE